jgi:hypothetical protein
LWFSFLFCCVVVVVPPHSKKKSGFESLGPTFVTAHGHRVREQAQAIQERKELLYLQFKRQESLHY